HVRIDRAERIVRGLRLAGARDCVEKSGFADVRKTDDTCCEHYFKKWARTLRATPMARNDQHSGNMSLVRNRSEGRWKPGTSPNLNFLCRHASRSARRSIRRLFFPG